MQLREPRAGDGIGLAAEEIRPLWIIRRPAPTDISWWISDVQGRGGVASDRQPLPVGAGDQRACRPGFQRHGNQQGKDGLGVVSFVFDSHMIMYFFIEAS